MFSIFNNAYNLVISLMKFDESYQGCRRTCQYHRCSDAVLQYMRYIRYIYFYTKFLSAMVCLISLCSYILVQNFITSYLSAQKILIHSLKLDMMHIIRHVKNLISFLEVVLRRLKNQLNSTCITFIVFDMNLHVVKCLQQPLNFVKFILLLVSSKYGAKNKGASIT